MHIQLPAMKRSILTLLLLSAVCAIAEEAAILPEIDETEVNGTLIPKDIYDAYRQLDYMLSPTIKRDMANGSEKELANYHFQLGGWIRNNWGLWRGSDLAQWFNSKGIDHPDDMSGIVLKSYRRYLRQDPLELDGLMDQYVRYWKIREKPATIPCENGKIVFALHHSPEGGNEHYYHVAKCGNPDMFMVFEYDRGWGSPTEQMRIRIDELIAEEGLISAPLYEP